LKTGCHFPVDSSRLTDLFSLCALCPLWRKKVARCWWTDLHHGGTEDTERIPGRASVSVVSVSLWLKETWIPDRAGNDVQGRGADPTRLSVVCLGMQGRVLENSMG